MKTRTLLASSFAAASVAALGFAAPATAAPATAAPSDPLTPRTSLVVSGPGGVRILTCDPLGTNTHPHQRKACVEFDEAQGDIAAIPPQEGVLCTKEYNPTPISARGTWRGKSVSFKDTAGNPCMARVAHGYLFDF